jgi:hypothetical protein
MEGTPAGGEPAEDPCARARRLYGEARELWRQIGNPQKWHYVYTQVMTEGLADDILRALRAIYDPKIDPAYAGKWEGGDHVRGGWKKGSLIEDAHWPRVFGEMTAQELEAARVLWTPLCRVMQAPGLWAECQRGEKTICAAYMALRKGARTPRDAGETRAVPERKEEQRSAASASPPAPPQPVEEAPAPMDPVVTEPQQVASPPSLQDDTPPSASPGELMPRLGGPRSKR